MYNTVSLDTESIKYFFSMCIYLGIKVPTDEDFLNALDTAVFSFEDIEDLSTLYYDTGIQTSFNYIDYFNSFSDILFDLGYGDDIWDDGEETPSKFVYIEKPWEEGGTYYTELEKSSDFWWFLVMMIQKFGAIVRERPKNSYKKIIKYKEIADKLKSYLNNISIVSARLDLMKQYEFIGMDKFLTADFSNVDVSNLKSVDEREIPEYDVDSYVNINNKFYKPLDVFLAITASSGMAQSLERQDLEDKVVNSSDRVSKKINRIGVLL